MLKSVREEKTQEDTRGKLKQQQKCETKKRERARCGIFMLISGEGCERKSKIK